MNTQTQLETRLGWGLLSLRVSVFLVMLIWCLDKFVNPDHGARVFELLYSVGGVPPMVVYAFGTVQLLLMLAFVLGLAKRFTYGAVFVLHGITTLASMPLYFDVFKNILFFTAWPMWAACFVLYILRDYDNKYVIGRALNS